MKRTNLDDLPPCKSSSGHYARDLFDAKEPRSVTANSRHDAAEFRRIAGQIPIKSYTVGMQLDEANRALNLLERDGLRAAAVLHSS